MDNIKIETERLLIRPISMFDAKDMFEYAKDPEMTRFLGWDAHKKIEDTLAILKTMVEREDNYPTFAIVLKENKKMIGTIDAIIFGKGKALKAEIGYALSREYWSKGIMTKASCRASFYKLWRSQSSGEARFKEPRVRKSYGAYRNEKRGDSQGLSLCQGRICDDESVFDTSR